jgi:hypothetical protein
MKKHSLIFVGTIIHDLICNKAVHSYLFSILFIIRQIFHNLLNNILLIYSIPSLNYYIKLNTYSLITLGFGILSAFLFRSGYVEFFPPFIHLLIGIISCIYILYLIYILNIRIIYSFNSLKLLNNQFHLSIILGYYVKVFILILLSLWIIYHILKGLYIHIDKDQMISSALYLPYISIYLYIYIISNKVEMV